MTSRFETLWKAFVEEQRRVRAPEALHRRVRAAIRQAAGAGASSELPPARWRAGARSVSERRRGR